MEDYPDAYAREDPTAELHLPSPRQPSNQSPAAPVAPASAMLSYKTPNRNGPNHDEEDPESSSVEFDEPRNGNHGNQYRLDYRSNSASDVSDLSKSDANDEDYRLDGAKAAGDDAAADESLKRLLDKYNLRSTTDEGALQPLSIGVGATTSSYGAYESSRFASAPPPPPPPPLPPQQKQQISVYDYLSEETKRYLSQAKFNSLEDGNDSVTPVLPERSTAPTVTSASVALASTSGTARIASGSQKQQQQPQYLINKYMENIKTMVSDALTCRPTSANAVESAREKPKDQKRPSELATSHSQKKPSEAFDSSIVSARQLDPEVRSWLNNLNLRNPDKYAALFERHEIDMESLLLLNTEAQLRKLGITAIGPLTKMLHSIRELSSNNRNRKRPASAPHQRLPSSSRRPDGVPPLHLHMARVVERQQKQKQLKQQQQQQQQKQQQQAVASPRPWIPGGARGRLDLKQQKQQKQSQQQQQQQPPSASSKTSKSGSKPATSPTSLCPAQPLNNKQLVSQAERDIAKAAQKVKQKELREKQQLLEERRQHNEWRQRRDDILRHRRPNPPSSAPTPRTPRKDHNNKPVSTVHKASSSSATVSSSLAPINKLSKPDEDTSMSAFRSEISEIERKISELLNDNTGQTSSAKTSSGSLTAPASINPNSLLDSVETFQKQLRELQSRVASHRQQQHQQKPQQQQQQQQQQQKQQSPPQKEEVRVSQSVTAKAVGFEQPSAKFSSLDAASGQNQQRRTSWTVSAGSYKFNEKEIIGEGTLTAVHRGRLDGEAVAVKRLKLKLTSDEDRSYLAAEANFLCSLRHPRLTKLFGYCLRGRFPLLFCELAVKKSLSDYLHSGGQVDHAFFYCLGQDLAEALEFLHSQRPPLLHMRLCSRNVLLDSRLRGQIADLGLSKLRHQAGQLAREAGNASAAWAHLAWMAPELLTAAEFGPPADLYSAGVLLWEMLTGQQPYSGQTAYSIITAKKSGATLEIPSKCDSNLKTLLTELWGEPAARLDASRLKSALSSGCLPGRLWSELARRAGVTEAALRDPSAVRRFLASACRRPCLDLDGFDSSASAGSFWLLSEPRLPLEPSFGCSGGDFSAELVAAVARAARGDE